MENNFLLTDELLWDYADGLLDEGDKRHVEAYLQQHPEQQKRLQSIMAEKRAFATLPLEKPRAGFADKVMAAWVAEQAHARAVAPAKRRDWILFAIAGVFGIFLLMAFALVIGTAPQTAPLTIPEEYVPRVPVVDWSAIFGSPILRYGFILVIALLSLQILDKYLQQRNRTHRLMPGI